MIPWPASHPDLAGQVVQEAGPRLRRSPSSCLRKGDKHNSGDARRQERSNSHVRFSEVPKRRIESLLISSCGSNVVPHSMAAIDQHSDGAGCAMQLAAWRIALRCPKLSHSPRRGHTASNRRWPGVCS